MSRKVLHGLCWLLAGLVVACANPGTIGGGPKDTTPPKLIRTNPAPNQVNYTKNKVELFFDEMITLDNVSQKVLISPPQKRQPIIKSIGKKVLVELQDTLLPGTTYTIDFTDAIVDNNEKNKLGDFAFSFSTGPVIDSLRIGGFLLDASNLNPVEGVYVGVHDSLEDSFFRRSSLKRISRTTGDGRFSIKGLPEKPFRVYALGDKNGDFLFDQPGEPIAFIDSTVTPWIESCIKADTVWKDTLTIDTIILRQATCYKPDDLILMYFAEDFGRQYLAKRERSSRHEFQLVFGYKASELPTVTLLNTHASNWYVLEKNPTLDTLRYWITDTLVASMDTLRLKVDYWKTDSTNRLAPWTDTLKLIARRHVVPSKQPSPKKGEDTLSRANQVEFLEATTSLQGVIDYNAEPTIEWKQPVRQIHGSPFHLYRKKDSLWVEMPCRVEKDSFALRRYNLKAAWDYGASYRFDVDSGAIEGLYGTINKTLSYSFKVREENEYARLLLTVRGLQPPFLVELLDNTDKVIRRGNGSATGLVDFKFLKPGTYYMRAIEDKNNNGKWDTGNLAEKRQPERVFYRPKPVKLRANWDVEDAWEVFSVPLLEQKPKELIKSQSKKT